MSQYDTSLIENSTVFVVDDHPVNVEILIKYLQSFNLIVIPIESRSELFEMLKTTIPDLILLDIILSEDESGYEICKDLKASRATADVPVIFISSLSEAQSKVEGFEAGGVDYVTKPVEPSELLSRVKAHLTIAGLHNRLQEANARLEEKVTERTRELETKNRQLLEEIEKRKAIEADLIDSIKEKDALLKEVHHRVKNNMQIVNSLFNLQVDSVVDPEDRRMFKDSQSRLYSMSLVYEQLYRSDNLARIRFDQYIRVLTEQLQYQFDPEETSLDTKFDTDEIELNIDMAMPCALISNELITNALRHAYVGRENGSLDITFKYCRENGDNLMLRVKDNGIGLPETIAMAFAGESGSPGADVGLVSTGISSHLGLNLVQNLALQIGASIACNSTTGAEFSLIFRR